MNPEPVYIAVWLHVHEAGVEGVLLPLVSACKVVWLHTFAGTSE